MKKIATFCLVALFLTCAILLITNGCGFSSPGSSNISATAQSKIQHVVIIFQENRTPDNLFHDPVLMARGADIAGSGINSNGVSIPLLPESLATPYDLDHSHKAFTAMYDSGKMQGANNVLVLCGANTDCPPPNPQYYYVQSSEAEPYFKLAEQYTFGDRMFQTNQGPSFPAHQFILSGTSAPTASSHLFAAENPIATEAGCAAPSTSRVTLIDPEGDENSSMYPCFEHPTLTDELNAKNISWRYYAPSAGYIWTAPNAIQHMCGPNAEPPNATACTGPDWVNNVVLYSIQNPAPILNDISSGTLATVSWVMPAGQNSDHAGSLSNTGGPSWVAAMVNAIGNSQYWSNTVILITWDDWGGWFDHVPPPKIIQDGKSWGSGYVYGFRVPLIVVSPYARAHYISHVNHDFGSILNFVEKTFNLPSLGYADAYADDLSDCFDFGQPPLEFQSIPAPLNADHFLNDRTPATDPDDD